MINDPRLPLRFWNKVVVAPNGCWLWQASLRGGYGRLNIYKPKRISPQAHRLAYETLVAPVARELDLDHTCRTRHCVNPAHLEPVTRLVNVRRGASMGGKGSCLKNRLKTHCKRGHPFDEQNTIRKHDGSRNCRECKNQQQRQQYAAKPLKEE